MGIVKRAWVVVAVATVLAWIGVLTIFPSVAESTTSSATERTGHLETQPAQGVGSDQLAAARSIRSTFNLDTSDEAINRVTSNLNGTARDFLGMKVTPAEYEKIARQLEVEKLIDERWGEIAAHIDDGFAGLWIDRDIDGVVVATKGDPARAAEAAAVEMAGVPVRIEVVRWSRKDLNQVGQEVMSTASSVEQDLGVISLAHEPMANRVVVGITEGSDLEHASRVLIDRYGAAVIVERSAIDTMSRTDGPPWMAGKAIEGPSYPTGQICTGAFGARRGNKNYVTTAGHCAFSPTLPSHPWTVGTNTLGSMTEVHHGPHRQGTFADVAAIEVPSSSWVATPPAPPNNCVYITESLCSTVLSYSDPSIGGSVCYSGARTDLLYIPDVTFCGTVTHEVARVLHNDTWTYYHDMYEATGFTDVPCAGDSGSPVFTPFLGLSFGVVGRGIISYRSVNGNCGSASGRAGFSKSSNIQKTLNIEGGCNGSWLPSGSCSAGTYSDVGRLYPYNPEIEWASAAGIVTGYADGTFKPDSTVTRQAAITFLWRQAGSPATGYAPGFTDVPPSHPFYNAIRWAWGTGRITGYMAGCSTGTPCFRGSDLVTRQAWAAFLYREGGSPYASTPPQEILLPFGHLCDVSTSHPFYKEIIWNVNFDVTRVAEFEDSTNLTCHQSFQPSGGTPRKITARGMYEMEH